MRDGDFGFMPGFCLKANVMNAQFTQSNARIGGIRELPGLSPKRVVRGTDAASAVCTSLGRGVSVGVADVVANVAVLGEVVLGVVGAAAGRPDVEVRGVLEGTNKAVVGGRVTAFGKVAGVGFVSAASVVERAVSGSAAIVGRVNR